MQAHLSVAPGSSLRRPAAPFKQHRAPLGRCRAGREALVVRARQSPSRSGGRDDPSYDILSAFFYGRALAITLNKRLAEAAIDAISEISKAVAEQPQRMKDFQDEVAALARKEMTGSSMLPEQASSSSSSGKKSGSPSAPGAGRVVPTDPQAAVDELRAEIAYARSSLQQLKVQNLTAKAVQAS